MASKIPYSDLSSVFEIKEQILSGRTPEPTPSPQNWPGGLLELVRKCWSQTPEERPTTGMCVESVDEMISLIERMREEVVEFSRSSFIPRERLQSGSNEQLRQAGNCTTKKGELLPSGALVVVKELNLEEFSSLSSRIDFCKRFSQQMTVSLSLEHANILEIVGYSVPYDFASVSLVSPYLVNGNLANWMENGVGMNGRLELARDAMSGLQYLHSREPPVVHGNITPANVLINKRGKAVLSDVGLTIVDWHPMSTSPKASVRCSSPEANLENSAVIQSDIWSWACVVLQLMTRDSPYSNIQNEDHIKVLMSFGPRNFLTPEAFHELDAMPDDVLLQLLGHCWEFDFAQRPDAQECVNILDSILRSDPRGEQTEANRGTKEQSSHKSTSNMKQLGIVGGASREEAIRVRRLITIFSSRKLMLSKTSEREADASRYSERPYVLKFVGPYKPEAHLTFVSLFFVNPFAQNGTLLQYVSDRAGINRTQLLCEPEVKQKLYPPRHHTTVKAKLLPFGSLVVLKEIKLSSINSLPPGIDVFKHMAALWSLKHKNIVEIIGYSVAIGLETVSLVTQHMASGNLTDYVRNELDMNRRLELVRDIVDGLQYLHSRDPPVIHGNLTPFNVLVSDSGRAVLDDYVLDVINGHYPSATVRESSARWSSPEVNLGNSAD
ncbi:hypothetical protein FRC01_009872, partial [Tulasnella sp. 417]